MKRNLETLKGRVNVISRAGIRAAATTGAGVVTLEIYGEIGESFWGDGVTATQISGILRDVYAAGATSLEIHVNSPGGDAFEGVAIYNILKACPLYKTVVVDGLAASAASLIAMAGDKLVMGLGTMLMIHPAMLVIMGSSVEMREAAALLEKVTKAMADIYDAKTKRIGTPKLLEMMYAETWMSPEEAIAQGFADELSETPNELAALTADFDLSVFAKVPVSLKSSVTDEQPKPEGWDAKSNLRRRKLEVVTL